MRPCAEWNRGSSFFPILSNHQIAFYPLSPPCKWGSALTVRAFCSKSHFPSWKVQPAHFLFLRSGTIHKDRLSVLPFLPVPIAEQARGTSFKSRFPPTTWVLRDFKLTRVCRLCCLLHSVIPDDILSSMSADWVTIRRSSCPSHLLILHFTVEHWAPLILTEEREETLHRSPHDSSTAFRTEHWGRYSF